ncbi:hypothetical protein WR25_13079 [Diploscapter pachys]|uniref:Uncharacterized protein n=1 Tax=Diploscapter pachys TaxID=2018661 RepID=A0A2A2JR73_9BILA|nr:hypothetical protein WR25_13079 [Diploscapter pachys]
MRIWMVYACWSAAALLSSVESARRNRRRQGAFLLDNEKVAAIDDAEKADVLADVQIIRESETNIDDLASPRHLKKAQFSESHRNRFPHRLMESSHSKFTRHQLRPPSRDLSNSNLEHKLNRVPKQISRRILQVEPIEPRVNGVKRRSNPNHIGENRLLHRVARQLTMPFPPRHRFRRRFLRQAVDPTGSSATIDRSSAHHRISPTIIRRQTIPIRIDTTGLQISITPDIRVPPHHPTSLFTNSEPNFFRVDSRLTTNFTNLPPRRPMNIRLPPPKSISRHPLSRVVPLKNFARFQARSPGISRRLPQHEQQVNRNSVVDLPSEGVDSFRKTAINHNVALTEENTTPLPPPIGRPLLLQHPRIRVNPTRERIPRPLQHGRLPIRRLNNIPSRIFAHDINFFHPRLSEEDHPQTSLRTRPSQRILPPLPMEFESVRVEIFRGHPRKNHDNSVGLRQNNSLRPNNSQPDSRVETIETKIHVQPIRLNDEEGFRIHNKSHNTFFKRPLAANHNFHEENEEDIEQAVIKAIIDSSTTTDLPSTPNVADLPHPTLSTPSPRSPFSMHHRSRRPQTLSTISSFATTNIPPSRIPHSRQHRIRRPRPSRPPTFTFQNAFEGTASITDGTDRTETILVDEDEEDSLRLHKGISGTPRLRTIDASTVRAREIAHTSVTSSESKDETPATISDDTDIEHLHREIENNILEAINSPFGLPTGPTGPPATTTERTAPKVEHRKSGNGPPGFPKVEHSKSGDGPPGAMPPNNDIVSALNSADDFMKLAKKLHIFRSRVAHRRRRVRRSAKFT